MGPTAGLQIHRAVAAGAQPLDRWQTGVMEALGLALDPEPVAPGETRWVAGRKVRLPIDVRDTRCKVPTTIIWGVNDPFIGSVMADASYDQCDDARLERMDATHWVQHEQPERVNALLLEGFRRRSTG